jgi:hypothetical protein
MCDELIDMDSKASRPRRFVVNQKINSWCTTKDRSIKPAVDTGDIGDVLIGSLGEKGTDCIIDVRVTDTDEKSYRNKDSHKVPEAEERQKKKKYLEPCLDQRHHFARTVIKTLAENQAHTTGKQYSHLCVFLRARLSIAIVRSSHICL